MDAFDPLIQKKETTFILTMYDPKTVKGLF